MFKEACVTQTDPIIIRVICTFIGYMIKVIIPVLVIIILHNQRSRAIDIFYIRWQLIGDGSGKSQLSTVGDQLELIVDIGLTVLTVAGSYLDIIGLVVIFSAAIRVYFFRRLVGRSAAWGKVYPGWCTRTDRNCHWTRS